MSNQEIYDLMARFENSSLYELRLSRGEFSLELRKNGGQKAEKEHVRLPSVVPAEHIQPEKGMEITAPLVGTFYTAPAPGADSFVIEGKRVSKGPTIGLIEAMKMMSEILAPCDCVIKQVVKENGTLAAFGEVLFRYEPC